MKKTSELYIYIYIDVNNKQLLKSHSLVITRVTCAFKRGVTVEQLCPCPPHDDGLAQPAACCWTSGACSLPALCGRPAAPYRTVGPVGLVPAGGLVGLGGPWW